MEVIEQAEECMVAGRFDRAAVLLLEAASRSVDCVCLDAARSPLRCLPSTPSVPLCYYRAALCALAVSPDGASWWWEELARASGAGEVPRAGRSRLGVRLATGLFHAAIALEDSNRGLRENVDLVLRVLRCAC